MINLKPNKKVSVKTDSRVFEKSKLRAVIIEIEHPNQIFLRLEGTRNKVKISAETLYYFAVRSNL